MANLTQKIRSIPGPSHWSAKAALICSLAADLIMAFLIVFGIVQSCSAANIAIYMVLLGVSALLAFGGILTGAVSFRKTKSRQAVTSLLLAILYAALLVFLIQLIYSTP